MVAVDHDKHNEEVRISAVALVPGLGVGRAFFLGTSPLQIHELTLPQEEVEHEIHRYYKALNRSKSDIVALEKKAKATQGQQEITAILQSHLEIIKDPILTEEVVNTIRKDRKNAEYVFSSVMGKIEESLSSVQHNSLAVDRIQDIHDISNRVIGHLCCQHKRSLGESDQNIIVFSNELTPSEAAGANPSYIRGFVSLVGAATSHTAIVARAKDIPYLANISQDYWTLMKEYNGHLVLIDGNQGEIIFNPLPKTLESRCKKKTAPKKVKPKASFQHTIVVSSQATSISELDMLEQFFPETSVGLFRSEFLAIADQKIPNIVEQTEVYKRLASFSGGISVLRLFDFGEDKVCPCHEPILGRSVHSLLNSSYLLDHQLQAVLAASLCGPIKLLIPGVADVGEIVAVKQRLEKLRSVSPQESIIENIIWGSMIEMPSAVWMIDEILKQCAFVSIGTNDLMQYSLGISRESVIPEYLNLPLHPSVVRMVRHVVESAKRKQVPVSICGEAAGSLELVPLFLGLGVTELSVAMPRISDLRDRIASLDMNYCLDFTEKILKARTCAEIQALWV
ncbi:phosphoenolpyruvate-protein phosphotransferase [Chlamydia ibidis]|uniref:Phosphoenolpyruvate-protein phosphotransferase n=2 Tax=Chlamydia ibidis TaxID=1405396 RepID=S7KIY0_9CHLA|nr:phosphoenolpyruvate--protein phosphotransferase [Chlamydia ibidis]EPP34370.1 phosphoenolpyruvate-protein phosphotransferase [Chlamydia ibidis]EQM62817.1 phosphoenolpyruvate-protein phosphotransferase [Chlamydia ibidis 10-1398/6]